MIQACPRNQESPKFNTLPLPQWRTYFNLQSTEEVSINLFPNFTNSDSPSPDTGSTNRTQHSPTQLTKFVGCCVPNNQQMLSWYWVPNNQHPSFQKLVLCTQHQQLLGSVGYPTFFWKRSSMRKESFLPQGFFSCPKNKPVIADFKYKFKFNK